MTTQAELIDCLHDIYAMEKSKEKALKKLIDHPHNHPALREQATLHGTETRRHAEAVVTCLKRLGSDPSSLQMAPVQNIGADLLRTTGKAFARDERINDVLAVLVTKHFDIACHTVLRTGAEHLGFLDIVCVCDQIIDEEKRMARWLQLNLPQIITAYIVAEDDPEAHAGQAQNGSVSSQNGHSRNRPHWEFAQLGQNASLFGGPLPRCLSGRSTGNGSAFEMSTPRQPGRVNANAVSQIEGRDAPENVYAA